MQRHWTEDELALYWSLATEELTVLPPGDASSRLGVALSLKFCQLEGRFPGSAQDLPPVALQYVAKQLDLDPALAMAYDWQGRTGTRYRHHLRTFLGIRPATVADIKGLGTWLRAEIVPWDHDLRHLQAAVVAWCRDHHLEPPSEGRIDRVLRSLVRTHEHDVCTRVAAALLPTTRTAMEALLDQRAHPLSCHAGHEGGWAKNPMLMDHLSRVMALVCSRQTCLADQHLLLSSLGARYA